jgi:hypothetical protein
LFAVSAVVGLIISLVGSTPAYDKKKDRKPVQKVERSLMADPAVTVTLCVSSGTLKVRGWDKNEVHVSSMGATQVDLKRVDKTKDTSKPPTRVDVMVLDKLSGTYPKRDCQALADVEMQVPSGATVQIQTRDGDISIAGVAGAYAGSQNGDISIERVVKLVEAGSVGGSIYLKDSSGRINLSSAGGGIEVVNVRSASHEDTFEVGTVSGDILLTRVANPKVIAKTVSGTVIMSGPLAKSGYYGFTSMTGDVVLSLPHDASFKLNAKVSDKHDLVSDFSLQYVSEAAAPPAQPEPRAAPRTIPKPPAVEQPAPKAGPVVAPIVIERPRVLVPYVLRRVNAICGSGDATISVASFGGSIRLKKL